MSRFEWNEGAWQQVRRAAAMGLLNACHAIEAKSKSITPVHGDPTQGGIYSTFTPGARPIGGTLRRSQHSAVYVDGIKIAGATNDENGTLVPEYIPRKGIAGFVGTNVFYALFVHDGTVKMDARPFLATAVAELEPDIPGYVASGMAAALGGRTR